MAKWLLAGLLATGMSGCTTVLSPEETAAIGPPFNDQLRQKYVELAEARWADGSWDVLRFRDKARAAMLGEYVLPDPVMRVSSRQAAELVEERRRLLAVLDAGARRLTPEDAADAQVSFDCWLALVKASGVLESDCRGAFETALASSESALVDALPTAYAVAFESGSDVVDSEGLNTATAVAHAASVARPARISVIGYADPSGSASYNEALSRRRAENVAAALQEAGVAGDLLAVQAQGAASGAAARRVEIAFDR